jgi:FecR protein
MRRIALCLWLCPVLCAQTRYARLGEVEGTVEAQIHPSEPWKAALRNTPLVESSSLRTGPASHVEIELDEGSVLRLAENSACELSDYTRLSTGQRITHISLDRGTAYFSGESSWRDALILSLPNAQVSIRRGSRVRMEAASDWSQIAVVEGEARLSSAAIELDVPEGKMLKLPLGRSDKFYLLPEISQLDSDTWSLTRDKLLVDDASRNRLPGLRYGVRDLDAVGEWIDTAEFGMAWKPKTTEGWAPFRDGKWQWYEGLGFTWIGAESWGWLPYHYGRWMLQPSQGWIWAPGARHAFKPGDVYWLRGSGLLGWGPLAPGEAWAGVGTPSLYLKSTSTFARYSPSADLREIDPAGFTATPKDPLAAAVFLESLPSPRISRDRVEYERSPDRPGVVRLSPNPPPADHSPQPEPERSQPVTRSAPPPVSRQIVQQTIFVAQPAPAPTPEPIVETYYVAPIYTGIIVLNPPEKKPPPKLKKGTAPAQPTVPAQSLEPAN